MGAPQYSSQSADVDEARRLLLKAWQQALGDDGPIEDSDNFFELGGHSLLALNVSGMLSDELGMDVPVQILFDYPDLGGQAAAIAELLASQ